MAKNNMRSIRLSDKVMDYIMNYRGDGFNEKFENIILDAMESEDDRKKSLEMYDRLIAQERKKYYDLRQQMLKLDLMVQACLRIDFRVKELNKEFDDCITELSGSPESQAEK